MWRFVLMVALAQSAAFPHEPITTKVTFSKEVSRIFQKRCLSCHREGGTAPMSLETYASARPWAKAIKEEVLERRMPPWGAVKGFGAFRNEQALTQEEVSLIADWVEGGAPEGDPKYLPPKISPQPPSSPTRQGWPLAVASVATVARSSHLLTIEPRTKTDVASARLVAELPDGSIEPLIWLRDYKSQWAHRFELRRPLRLPAGTKLRVEPPVAARFILYFR
ncbi:MAG: cytochrome c [Bryobacteraceae bacterium]|nr:cytochrome c [Bryobacteraceae bacterium]MDW8378117.1 cytochrome c [Bryobacterales bacterium]